MGVQKLKKWKDAKGNSYVGLYRDEVTEVFYYRKESLGKISLGTTDPKKAIAKLTEAHLTLKQRAEKSLVKDGQNVLVSDIYQKMIEMKIEDGIRPATKRRIETIWENQIKPYFENRKISSINQEMVDDFKSWFAKNHKGKQLINVFKYLGNILRIAQEYGYLSKVPRLEIPERERKHHATKKGRVVSREEFQSIISQMSPPYSTITKIAYYMGMRKMEIGSLKTSQLLSEGDLLFIDLSSDDTKTGIARTIPVPAFLKQEILDSVTGALVFSSKGKKALPAQLIDRAWRVAKEKAGIEGRIRFHDLRGTCATNMARANINPVLAVTYLGMSLRTYQTTYLKLDRNDLLDIARLADKILKGEAAL